ncbi:MAG: glycine cleavage system aminomethyltransferase GcvT [Proteobacteria bacterium]|nr:glycine cleavage system aminomethyltransferase GcvT [Pseudomonadota bacterium]
MLKRTPLYEAHLALGATIVNFADWQMPLHYGSQINEHHCVRTGCGVFDVSHMAIIDISGVDAKPFLRYLVANDVQKLTPNKALYTCLLNDKGGVKDDLIIYCINEDQYRLVVNAATQDKDLAWIKEKASAFTVDINLRRDLGMLAIQGPQSWQSVAAVLPEKLASALDLKPFHFVENEGWMIAHTGYTGETGMEIMMPESELLNFWQKLMAQKVQPVGLGARDSLRLEAGFNLYGQDMDETTSPLVSNLAWTVDFKDPGRAFIGKQALEKEQNQGVLAQLVGIVLLEKGVCRAGMKITGQDEAWQGIFTSGGFSPTLSCGIGLARIPIHATAPVWVQIRDKKIKAKIIKPPFVKKGKANFD